MLLKSIKINNNHGFYRFVYVFRGIFKCQKYVHFDRKISILDNIQISRAKSANTTNETSSNDRNESHILNDGLQRLLEHDKGFEAFMRHLTKEWSSENLLFFLETIQFQNYVIDYHNQLPIAKQLRSNMPLELRRALKP